MAFNPLVTFHKNKRFWMALILMVCMFTFVFLTGRGDLADRVTKFALGRSGPAVITIDGRGVSDRDLSDLKMQRNLANSFMRICADTAHKRLAKLFFDEGKRPEREKDKDKDIEARAQELLMLKNMERVIDERRAKPRYFDIGTKFDDLVEFKLWQAEADRLGIKLEPEHITLLFNMEFFGARYMQTILPPKDISDAQFLAKRDIHRDASDTFIHQAIGEEFRVRIAQYVVLGAQPYSFIFRKKRDIEGFTLKFSDAAMPDETRAPLTMAQLFDIYKAKRSDFVVELLPIKVEDFISTLKEEPTEAQKREFFEARKGKSYDPSVDEFAPEITQSAKIEYVYADVKSEFYLGKAKLISALKATDSIAFDAALSPLGAVAHEMAIAYKHKVDLQAQYDTMVNKIEYLQVKAKVSKDDRYRGAALIGDADCAAPVFAYMASQHDDLVAKLICASAMAPIDGLSSFLAQGASGHAQVKAALRKEKDIEFKISTEAEAALRSEAERRAPRFAALFGSLLMGSINRNDLVAPILTLDAWKTGRKSNVTQEEERLAALHPAFQVLLQKWEYVHPHYTVETVQQTLQAMIDERMAEEWAQENMLALKAKLERNNDDPGKYRRVLNEQEIKDMKLTYGPPADKKNKYYNRFDISDAEEFKVLKESYLRYLDMINLFEGRDVSAGGVLKASDYWKMFFDQAEPFSVGSSIYRAMPWPPEVTAKVRNTSTVNPRLFNPNNVVPEDIVRFKNHLDANDPNREPPKLDLFKTAARPILFWRTAEILANRPNDYAKIGQDLEEFKAERARIEADLAKIPENGLLLGKYDKIGKGIEEFTVERAKIEAELAKNPKDGLLLSKYDKIGKEIEAFKAERAKIEADLSKNPKNSLLLSKKGELEQAAGELKTIQSRIVQGWKAEQARKVALPEAKLAAEKVLDFPGKYDVGLEKAAERLKTEFNQKDVALIALPKLSQWQPEKFANRGTDYGPPQLKDDRIKYPREDMMKQLLSLYDLPSEIKTVSPDMDPASKLNAERLDAINKELFDKAVKAAPGSRGVFVQILTNKPRTIYFVAAVTQLPKVDERQFAEAMRGAPFPQDFDPSALDKRDHFAERAQEEQAQVYRRELIDALRRQHKVEVVNEEARKKFDEHGGND